MSQHEKRPSSLALNTVAQSVSRLLGYALSFASAPVIVGGLGLRQFGIWALTGALAQYAALIDLGTGISLSRYVAANAQDRRVCGEYMAVALCGSSALVCVLGLVVIPAAGVLSHVLHGISTSNMRIVLWSSVMLTWCSLLTAVIAAYPVGKRRMLAPNIGISIAAVINFVASVGSIALGAGLPGYALANAGAGLLGLAVLAAIVISAEGRIPFSLPRRATIRSFLSYSTKYQLVRVMDLVNFQTDKIVIAFSIGPAAAGAYELANRVAIAVRGVGIYATSALEVELTALLARHGLESVRERYRRLTSIAATFGFPPVLLAIASAPLLLRVWLAHAPPNSAAVLAALCAAYLVAVSTGVSYGVAAAAGELGVVAKTAVGTAFANIVLTAGLAPFFGIWGVLAGTVAALSMGAIAQVVCIHRRYGLALALYVNAVLPALRWYALMALPVAAISYGASFGSRGAAAVALVLVAIAYLASCGVWAARTERLPQALLRRVVPGYARRLDAGLPSGA